MQLKCPNCFSSFELCPSIYSTRTKNNNDVFCSRTCVALFYAIKTEFGLNNRSKIEIFMEEKIKSEFPELKCNFNDREICNGLELDIYFPTLSLAIELNGIFHYQQIFSAEHFEKIQNHDNIKKNSVKITLSN